MRRLCKIIIIIIISSYCSAREEIENTRPTSDRRPAVIGGKTAVYCVQAAVAFFRIFHVHVTNERV